MVGARRPSDWPGGPLTARTGRHGRRGASDRQRGGQEDPVGTGSASPERGPADRPGGAPEGRSDRLGRTDGGRQKVDDGRTPTKRAVEPAESESPGGVVRNEPVRDERTIRNENGTERSREGTVCNGQTGKAVASKVVSVNEKPKGAVGTQRPSWGPRTRVASRRRVVGHRGGKRRHG